MDPQRPPVGLVFGSLTPPERIAPLARRAEDLGFEEFWFSEDCFFSGAMAGMAQILAATRRAPVGAGVVSAVTRHPAVTAMEFAGLSRMYPGRVRPGVALGVRAWLGQLGLLPQRPLTALRDTVRVLRALLDGEEVTVDDGVHRLDHVRLDFPPGEALPLHLGAVNGRALELSGEVADGTVLSVLSSPAYVRWARDRIATGAARAGRDPDRHRVTTFALYAVDDDPGRARDAVRGAVDMFTAAEATSALLRVPGVTDDDLAVAGTPEECARGLQRLFDAGSHAVCLWLFPTDRPEEVAERTAREVLPLLRRPAVVGSPA